jgi:hypothetical protein
VLRDFPCLVLIAITGFMNLVSCDGLLNQRRVLCAGWLSHLIDLNTFRFRLFAHIVIMLMISEEIHKRHLLLLYL